MSSRPLEAGIIGDAEKCVGYLHNLEFHWSGASRSRAIIEHLIAESRLPQHTIMPNREMGTPPEQRLPGLGNNRLFTEIDGDGGLQMEDVLWGDVLPWLDVNDQGGLTPNTPRGGM